MRIVVASRNPVKVRAAERAFAMQFPQATLDMISANVESGAGDQPMTDAATRSGARTRSRNASVQQPDADFWVGIEGGVDVFDGNLMAFAWMAVRDARGEISEARSVTLPLPPPVKVLVDDGVELGEANDRVFATSNSKQDGGAFGLLTEGKYTREEIYCQTLVVALIPFVHELFPQASR